MTPRTRTLLGVLILAALVPLMAGVLACLPVPIGDPEEGWIDPDLRGVWFSGEGDPTLLLLEPWDEHTWLVASAGVRHRGTDSCEGVERPSGYEEMMALLARDDGCLVLEGLYLYKGWQSRQGGHDFLTLEPRQFVLSEAEAAELAEDPTWFAYRMERPDEGSLSLRVVDEDFDGFSDVPKTREAYEGVVAEHVDSDDLYESEAWVFVRVPEEDAGPLRTLLQTLFEDLLDY
ncbi:MAG TPA: hypothetical protein VLA43_10975 [Longimicrobiales bacterium]|nr:hypothetical protein [Longimicrobiales bacterium]